MTLGDKDRIIDVLQENITTILTQGSEKSIDAINAQLERLQNELLKQANARKDYTAIADEIDRLRELKQNAMAQNAENEGLKQRITEMQDFLTEQTAEVERYDEGLVRRMIQKVTVYEDKFTVEFKSGTSVDVDR